MTSLLLTVQALQTAQTILNTWNENLPISIQSQTVTQVVEGWSNYP